LKRLSQDLIAARQGTLCEINFLAASLAAMGFIEFIRKNFFGLAAGWALAFKRFQMFELFIARTMLWCGHACLLILVCRFFSGRIGRLKPLAGCVYSFEAICFP
jgi:hypothetical protein